MSNQDQRGLLLSAIAHLKTQSANLSLPCLALCLSHYYRALSKICQREQAEYQEQAWFWLLCYLNNRCHAKKTRSMLLDQAIYSQLIYE